jgi:hypothetical protein
MADSNIKLFISYRRDDTSFETATIHRELAGHFGAANVFMDIDNIPAGQDFRQVVEKEISGCDAVLAVIGDRWLAAADDAGKPRLTNASDFVRLEVEAALKRGIPVVPILVRGATMPSPDDLPEALAELSFRNALTIRGGGDFGNDLQRLISQIQKIEAVSTDGQRRDAQNPPQSHGSEGKTLPLDAQGGPGAKHDPSPPSQVETARSSNTMTGRVWLMWGGGIAVLATVLILASLPEPKTNGPVTKADEFEPKEAEQTAEEQYAAGMSLYKEHDYPKAYTTLRAAADAGSGKAMNWIGTMHLYGDGVKRDPNEALQWFHKAAELDYPGAMANIGTMHGHGVGTVRDVVEALHWFKKAANLGHIDSMLEVARAYEKGIGVKKDAAEAERWLTKAKAAGHAIPDAGSTPSTFRIRCR